MIAREEGNRSAASQVVTPDSTRIVSEALLRSR
jgi:hypothetical protein